MRARNLKPSLFKHELLATSDPLYAWVFEGLWCMADREGRLEDRPRRIHLEINAGRAYEGTEASLAWLAENGFIVRYEHGAARYIQVLNFLKHQNPHVREPVSVIPSPEASTRQAPDSDVISITPLPGASTRPAPGQHQSGPALSSFPLPDSPSLIPDSSSLCSDGAEAPPPAKTNGVAKEKRPSRRCPPSFAVDDRMRAWAVAECPGVNVDQQTAAFRDYEFRNAHSDWPATWRTWIRKAFENQRGRAPQEPSRAKAFPSTPRSS